MIDDDDENYFEVTETHKGKASRITSDFTREKMSQRLRDRWVDGETFNKKSQQEIIQEFQKVHGDRYDYSKVEYVGGSTKVIIICKEHGEFLQRPSHHSRGTNCTKCGNLHRYNTEEIIQEFRRVHGDRYDYSKVEYVNSRTKVIIICKEHGEFLQSPHNHRRGSNCPSPNCGKQKKLIQEFQKVHGDRYDYSKVDYVNSGTKVIIICKEHGEFLQHPRRHRSGANCPKCMKRNIRYNTEEIIQQFQKVHGDRYDYSKVEYVHTYTNVVIICKEHGEFLQSSTNHKLGRGCPKCGNVHRHNTEEIIQQFQKVHGDRYDYSKVEYVNTKTKVIIICKEHGEFLKYPRKHRSGANCPKCMWKQVGKKRRTIITDTMTAQVIKLRNSKKIISAIAAEVGVSTATVKKILKVNA